MTTKEKRDQLFRNERPIIREMSLYQEGRISPDVFILYIAYQKHGLMKFPVGMDENQFFQFVSSLCETDSVYLAEDRNRQFSAMGPIAIIHVKSDGWNIEPHAIFFPWATPRNKLRSSVAFFQMARYKKIGACIVYCLDDSRPLFDKVSSYGVLKYVGKIDNAEPDGDRHIYSIPGTRGKRHGRAQRI